MPILFSAISRGTTVLAKYASCVGNFTAVTEEILSKIPPQDGKLTYSHGNYLFHYIAENRLVYFCITDADFERTKAFLFLNEIKRRFVAKFGDKAQTALDYEFNTEFMSVLMSQVQYFSGEHNAISKVQEELDTLKNIMVKNIESASMRGQKLEVLVDQADRLASTSGNFYKATRSVQQKYYWKHVKIYIILVIVAVIVVYLIGAMACGGLKWSTCV